MLIETRHSIPDEQAFRRAAERDPRLPEGFQLVLSIFSKDHSHVTCVWDAPSVAALQRFIEEQVDTTAQTTYSEVDPSSSLGLKQHGQPQAAAPGDPMTLHDLGKRLAAQGRGEQAFSLFQINAEQNPQAWFVTAGLARGYAAIGDRESAVKSMRAALQQAPPHRRERVQILLSRLEKGEDISQLV